MMYDFTDLIERHSFPFELVSHTGGAYVGGKWQSGLETISERIGAIIPLTERKIYQSGGTYSTKDRHLYMITPIEESLEGAQVRYKGNVYNIEEDRDFSDYSETYVYVLRWVSAFDRPQEQ